MMSEDEVARELEINYSLSVSGKVFSPFREHRHVSDKARYDSDLPVYRVWDFGKCNCTLYLQKDSHGRTKVLHERILTESSDTEQKRAALVDSFELFPRAEFRDICDPAGSDSTHYGSSSIQTLESTGPDGDEESISPDYYRIREYATKERTVTARKMVMRELQSTPGGEESLVIARGCTTLIKAFQGGYCYKKDNAGNTLDRVLEVHPFCDVMDTLFYFYLETDGTDFSKTDHIQPWDNDGGYVNPITGY